MEFKSWEQLTVVEQLQSEYSDYYKSVHDFRPRGMSDEQWNSEQWLTNAINSLHDTAKRVFAEEETREASAIVNFEASLDKLMECGAATRKDAVRWTLDANDALTDPDFCCYRLGLPYGYFKQYFPL